MASFDEKVAALKRLQEKRQAREDRNRKAEQQEADKATEADDARENTQNAQAEHVQRSVGKDFEGQALTSVLEHYAGLQYLPKEEPLPSGGGEAASSAAKKLAAERDDEGDALYCLGHCFEQGIHECEQDMDQAAMYYRLAAEKGSTTGQWRLGHLHEYGHAAEASDSQAAHWYRLAAEAGHPHAQSSLALLLDDGRASVAYDGEALVWHLAAAKQGNVLSQYCAACGLVQGGAGQDESAAMAWLEKSAAAGFPLAVEALSKGVKSLAQTKLWNHMDPCENLPDGAAAEAASGKSSLLDVAASVARKLEHLQDPEAEALLDELLSSLDDPSAFGTDELEEMLAAGKFDLANLSTPEATVTA